MNTERSAVLVAPSDIAELAGVSRAAVSNWRKREGLNFPKPVDGSATRPLFDKEAVIAWLAQQGKTIDRSTDRGLWEAAHHLRGAVAVEEMASVIAALACLRYLSADADADAWESLRALPEATPPDVARAAERLPADTRDLVETDTVLPPTTRLAPVITAISQPALSDLAPGLDFVIERSTAAGLHRAAVSGAVDSPAARLLAALATRHLTAGGTIHDPACGIAWVMTTALVASPDTTGFGYEINERAARLARQRALLAGQVSRLEVISADTLHDDPQPDRRADVVIAEPPFGLRTQLPAIDPRWPAAFPPAATDLAWVFHAVSHLSSEGRGYVLLPPGVLSSAPARSLRAELIANGNVHAIVALPPKTVPYTSIPLTLWVVGAPGTGDGNVRFIDASGSEDSAADVPRWLSDSTIGAPHAVVPVERVLATDSRLDPAAWVEWETTATTDELSEQVRRSQTDIALRIDALSELKDALRAPALPTDVRVMTVRELLELGYLQLVPARAPRRAGDEAPDNLVQVGDISKGRVDTIPGNRAGDVTAPGDVLMGTIGGVRAQVDHDGGHVLGTDVHAFRVAPGAPLDAEYLALTVAGSWNDRFAKGAGVLRVNYRDVEIPLVPLEDQREIVEFGLLQRRVREIAGEIELRADEALPALLAAVRQTGASS